MRKRLSYILILLLFLGLMPLSTAIADNEDPDTEIRVSDTIEQDQNTDINMLDDQSEISKQRKELEAKMLEDPELKEIMRCFVEYESFSMMPPEKQDLICSH